MSIAYTSAVALRVKNWSLGKRKEKKVKNGGRNRGKKRQTYTLNYPRPHPRNMSFDTLTPRTRNNQRTSRLNWRQ